MVKLASGLRKDQLGVALRHSVIGNPGGRSTSPLALCLIPSTGGKACPLPGALSSAVGPIPAAFR